MDLDPDGALYRELDGFINWNSGIL
jgi:hypothetical protein